MKIGFIGAGKVGNALGYYLYKYGIEISGYYSNHIEHAKIASHRVETNAFESIEELIHQSDVIIVTTTDNQIQNVGNLIYDTKQLTKQQIILHTSGAHSSKIFGKLYEQGYCVGSMHPIQAFADFEMAVKQLEETYFTLEGDKRALESMKILLKQTGNKYFEIEAEQKPLYHAGACVLSNYLVTLMDYGLKYFEAAGLNKGQVIEAMMPLIKGTLANVESKGTVDALTGPIVRGDVTTIENHLKAGGIYMPKEMDLYKELGKKTLGMIENKRMSKEEIQEKFSKNLLSEEDLG